MFGNDGLSCLKSNRNRCIILGLFIIISILHSYEFFNKSTKHEKPSIAFFYGKPIPTKILSQFDQVVVESDNIDNIVEFKTKGVEVFAYLSVGEINPSRSWYTHIPHDWKLGQNQAWGSSVIDMTQKGWHEYLINTLMRPLWEKGYQGFFLDTLDSYQLFVKELSKREEQKRALIELIELMHQRFPGVKIILNRGFELLPDVSGLVVAISAESLFQRWDPLTKSYSEVPVSDREWLMKKLLQIHNQLGLRIIVIDYVSPKEKALARKVADEIKDSGFIPWVSSYSLDTVGLSNVDVFSKQFLVIYDGQEKRLSDLKNTFIYKSLTQILNYFDYSIEYLDARKKLPGYALAGRYTKIITFFESYEIINSSEYKAWHNKQVESGLNITDL